MIKNVRKSAAAVLMAAGVSVMGSASAAVITDVEGAEQVITKKPVHIRHVITDGGYAVGLDTIASATLEVVLTDDNDIADYKITFGSGQQALSGTNSLQGGKKFKIDLDEPSLADLATTGSLDMTISAKGCKAEKCPDYAFRFLSSTLTVKAERLAVPEQAPAAVPEPGTLSLLGLGLAGLAALGRRRPNGPARDDA